MENEDIFLTQDYFKSSYKKEDVTKLPAYKQWIKVKKEQEKKVVKCPWCWGYEVFKEPKNHTCPMCNNVYCQKCLKKCVENEMIHNHERKCCSLLREIIEIMTDWAEEGDATPMEYFLISLLFIFGNHTLFTIKYFNFFRKFKVIDNGCVHTFFMYMNLFANIFYCIVFNIAWFELFFFLFFPGFFIPFYFKFITKNWLFVLGLAVDQIPIFELTVNGRGYDMY